MIGRWEWIIVEVLVVALLVYELMSVRRAMRDDKKHRDR
jgi:hypothetical protein